MEIEGTRLTVLAERAGVSKQAIGQTMKEMAALGFVRLERDPDDARAKRVMYTPAGLDLVNKVAQVDIELAASLGKVLPDGELEELRASLKRLAVALLDRSSE